MYRFEEPLDEFIGGFKISDRELAQQFQWKVKIIRDFLSLENYDLDIIQILENALNNKLETQLKRYGFKVFTIRENNPPTKDAILNQMQPIKPTKSQISASIFYIHLCTTP